jgi:hypothetical protein
MHGLPPSSLRSEHCVSPLLLLLSMSISLCETGDIYCSAIQKNNQMFDRLIAADLTRLVHTYNTFCEKFAQVLV